MLFRSVPCKTSVLCRNIVIPCLPEENVLSFGQETRAAMCERQKACRGKFVCVRKPVEFQGRIIPAGNVEISSAELRHVLRNKAGYEIKENSL